MTTEPAIQVGIDGAWRDAGALEWAVQEAMLRREALEVVTVIDDAEPDQVAIGLLDGVAKYLDQRLPGAEHHGRVATGTPARELVRLAEGSRMLVIGRRGTGACRRAMIGSVSEAVAIAAGAPVVVVPQFWTPAGRACPVVVAVDGSACDSPAVVFAREAAVLRESPLRLVHVWNLPAIYPGDVPSLGEEWWETAAHRLEQLADELRARCPSLPVATELRSGHVVSGIVAAATETGAQLLVVGGRARAWPSNLPDSATRGILRLAGCPVAIVHDGGR
ncbi:universal stress protein [Kribbella sp. HUAS MG21]|jgi:nucleotide-binding universal stress UspA family protein|uniref:Universal stress protein n=1 Tax=Kribbella sp. HUAS MG21 TaxID=3160966 RepID=A0AAU7T881_9ACTN